MKRTYDELMELLEECESSSYDGKNRCVADSADIMADGQVWAVISDHGNAELGYKGKNGHLYWIGGLV